MQSADNDAGSIIITSSVLWITKRENFETNPVVATRNVKLINKCRKFVNLNRLRVYTGGKKKSDMYAIYTWLPQTSLFNIP